MSGCHAPIGNVVYSSDYIKPKIHSCSCIRDPKRPWRCPICEGKGIKFDKLNRGEGFNLTCKSCEGTGIVWG